MPKRTPKEHIAVPRSIDTWPVNPWHPMYGLLVWDGQAHYKCAYLGSGGFECGKCGWKLPTPEPLRKPGDVCPECFSVAIGRERPYAFTLHSTMTKEEFAKHYPDIAVDPGTTP